MKLYITPGSPYARIARVVVLEKGLASRVEIIAVRPSFAATAPPGARIWVKWVSVTFPCCVD